MPKDRPGEMNKKWWIAGTIGFLAIAAALLIAIPELRRRALAPPPPPAGPNGRTAVNSLFDGSRDLQQERARLHELLLYTHYSFPGGEQGLAKAVSAGPPAAATGSGIPLTKSTPNFLTLQTTARVFRAQAVFLLLQGKQEEALQLLADVYHAGRIMAEGNLLIARVTGVAVCSITQAGVDQYVFDACETPKDHAEAEQVITSLASAFPATNADQIVASDGVLLLAIPERNSTNPNPDAALKAKD